MNGKPERLERSPGDLIFFAITFVGVIVSAGSLVTTSVPGCVVGFLILALGIAYFLLMSE